MQPPGASCTLAPFAQRLTLPLRSPHRQVLSGQRASAIPGRYSWDLRRLVELMLRPDPREVRCCAVLLLLWMSCPCDDMLAACFMPSCLCGLPPGEL